MRRLVDQARSIPNVSHFLVQKERARGRLPTREQRPRVIEQVALLHPFDSGSKEIVVDDRTSSACAASSHEHLGHVAEHLVQHLGHLEHVGMALMCKHRIGLDSVRIFVRIGDGARIDIARAVWDEDFVPVRHRAHGGVVVHERIDLVHVDREPCNLRMAVRVVVGKPVRVRRAACASTDTAFVVPAPAAAHEEDDDVVRGLREIDVERVLTTVAAGRALGFVLHPGAELGRFETAAARASSPAAATAIFPAARGEQS